MWTKLKEQLPALALTLVVVLGAGFGAAWWFHNKTIADLTVKQEQALARLREQRAEEIRTANDESNRRIEALNTLLREAIQKRAADAFMTEEEFAKANADRINQLATAIATKIQPYNPLPKTPEEAARTQNEQIDRVSARMTDRIQPILAEMAKDQNLTRASINLYAQRVSDTVGTVLTNELAKNQQLNNNLLETQAIARDSLRLSQEVTVLYLSTFKDQGLVSRILSLPVNVVKDVASLNLVNSRDKKKVQQKLADELSNLDHRLEEAQAKAPKN